MPSSELEGSETAGQNRHEKSQKCLVAKGVTLEIVKEEIVSRLLKVGEVSGYFHNKELQTLNSNIRLARRKEKPPKRQRISNETASR